MKKLDELRIIEADLKEKRDFSGLITVFDELMELNTSVFEYTYCIQQKAYCYARIGKSKEAEKTLMELADFAHAMGEDFIWRASALLSFFMTTKASELNIVQINTIKDWLRDPQSSNQVKQIIFDYKDIVGNI